MVPFEVSIAILNHFFGLRPEAPKFEFATDSPLEGGGFEPPVPRQPVSGDTPQRPLITSPSRAGPSSKLS
jgi:hypothetical protein